MFTESDSKDAGALIKAAALIGLRINDDLRRQLDIDIQSAFDSMVPLDGRGDFEEWL